MERQKLSTSRSTRAQQPTRRNAALRLYYSDREVAEMLSISPSMVRKLRRLGRLDHVTIGRAVRIPAEAVTAYCDSLRSEH